MGAWGTGNWQNDDALDWLEGLSRPDAIREALSVALEPGAILGTGKCIRALAAAEVVAACHEQPGDGLPDEVAAWVTENRIAVGRELVILALEAAIRINTSSELQQLFDEGRPDDEWQSVVDNLCGRLKRIELRGSEGIQVEDGGWT